MDAGPVFSKGGVLVHSVTFIISERAAALPASVAFKSFGSEVKSCISSGDQFNTLGYNLSDV